MKTTSRASRSRQHTIQALALVILVVFTVAVSIPLQRLIDERMEDLKRDVIALLESATGRTITFSRFSPSILRYLDIRDMKLLEPVGASPRSDTSENVAEQALVSINRLRIYFDLFAFLRGKRQEAIRRISIEDTTIRIDLERDDDIVDLIRSIAGAGAVEEGGESDSDSPDPEVSATAPRVLPGAGTVEEGRALNPDLVIGGKNLSIDLVVGDRKFRAEDLFFDLSAGEATYRLEMSADVSAKLAPGDPVDDISTSIAVNTSVGRSFDLMNGTIRIDDLSTNDLSVANQTFQLRMRDNIWTLRKIQDSLPIDIELSVDANTAHIDAEISVESFSPLAFIRPKGKLAEITPYIDLELNGNAMAGMHIDEGRIEYRADLSAIIPYDFLPAELSVATTFSGNESGVEIESLFIDSEFGSLEYAGEIGFGSIQPSGIISVRDLTYPLDRPISGTGAVSYRDGIIRFESRELTVDDEILRNVGIRIEQREDGADFTGDLDLDNPVTGVGSGSRIAIEGTAIFGDERSLDLAAEVTSVAVSSLFALAAGSDAELPIPGLAEAALVDADIFVQSDFERISFSVPSIRLTNGPQRLSLELTASGGNEEIRISSFAAAFREETLTGNGAIAIEGQGLASIRAAASYRGQSYSLTGEYDAETGIFIRGDYGIDAAILPSSRETLIRVGFAGLPIPIGDTVITGTADINGTFASADDFSISVREGLIENLELLPTGPISVEFAGEATAHAVSLSEIALSDQHSRIEGTLDVQYSLDSTPSFEGSGGLANDVTGERYVLNGLYTQSSLRLTLDFEESPLARFGELPLEGNVSGNVTVSGSPASPDFRAGLRVRDGRLNDGEIDLTASIELNDRHLAVEGVEVDLRSTRISEGSLDLDFADASFSGGARIAGTIQNNQLSTAIEASGKFNSPIGKTNLADLIDSDFALFAAAREVVLGDPPRNDWEFDITRTGERITIGGGIGDSVDGVIDLDGNFDVTLSEPLPVSVHAVGSIAGGEIDAVLSNIRIDMEGVESIITIPFFTIAEGTGVSNGNTLRLSGRLNDPDIYGEIFAKQLKAHVPVVPEIIGPFDGRLSFQGKKLVIDNAFLPVGNGAVYGYVDFTLDHWLPREYEIELVTDPENRRGLHIQYVFGRIDVDGYANGVLTVSGDPISTKITGDLAIRNTEIQLGEKKAFATKPGGPGLILDLTFTTDRQVIFFWPSKNLPVLQSFAATGQKLRLRSDYLDDSLSIVGNIDVQGGDIYYFQRSFNIRRGEIRFNENQDRFDPFLNVRADAKDRTDDGEDLTLTLIIENQTLSAFNPRFESDPPMATIDILSRLGQSIVHDESGNPSLSSAIALTTDVISRFGIFRTMEQRIRDVLQLDLFSLRTQIIQNILTDNLFPTDTGSGSDTSALARYLDNTTLYLGKYLRNDLFIEAMFRLSANQALITSAHANNDLFVESEIRLEWQTPLFLLEFSMLPDFLDPMASITRSTIGLSWDF